MRCFIDIETTGLVPERGAITRIAAIKAKRAFVVDIMDICLNPEQHVDPSILAMTGLDQRVLDLAPTLAEQKSTILKFFRGCEELVGWGDFENKWLRYFGLAYHVVNLIPRVKTKASRKVFRNYQLSTVATELGIILRHHDALSDVLALYQIANVVGV